MTSAKVSAALRPFRGAAIGSVVVLLVSFCAYRLHFNLSAAASLDILIVLFVTLWFGFWQATATSFAAVGCLAYFFAPPILSFYVADPHNWVALAVFELTALIVSQLSTQAQNQKRRAVLLHDNATRLYDFSRSILMLNRREPPGAQIASLIHKTFRADGVVIFDATIPRLYTVGSWTHEDEELARSTYFQNTNSDCRNFSRWQRVLHNGSQPLGALVLSAVNQMLLQPFVNYNLAHKWYLTSSPIITANWKLDDGRWLVPVGGGVGKIVRFGKVPVNIYGQVFGNAEYPNGTSRWSARFQMQFLFPRK